MFVKSAIQLERRRGEKREGGKEEGGGWRVRRRVDKRFVEGAT